MYVFLPACPSALPCLALYFPAPHSFTGEDVLELQGHGGPVILNLVLQRVLGLGARMARAGEFSERAFLNDRMDLVQAEAVADLIESGTEAAARAAQRSLEGEFSAAIQRLQATLTELRVFVESAIDFPDEEIDFLEESDITRRLRTVETQLSELLANARQGRLLRDGVVVAISGKPNAGKSSLLNALAGSVDFQAGGMVSPEAVAAAPGAYTLVFLLHLFCCKTSAK